MKGILIDPVKRSVETLESEFELLELHRLIEAETLDFCYPFGRTEELAVDDEGMYHNLLPFRIAGYQWPIWGRGGCRWKGGVDSDERGRGLRSDYVHMKIQQLEVTYKELDDKRVGDLVEKLAIVIREHVEGETWEVIEEQVYEVLCALGIAAAAAATQVGPSGVKFFDRVYGRKLLDHYLPNL
jgi:hypothetical protein